MHMSVVTHMDLILLLYYIDTFLISALAIKLFSSGTQQAWGRVHEYLHLSIY